MNFYGITPKNTQKDAKNKLYMTTLTEFKFKKFVWLHSADISKKTTDKLGKRFNLHPDDLANVLPPNQRPKLVVRPNYIFMILLYPFYDKKIGSIMSSEVDFFISRDFIITFNKKNKLQPIKELLEICQDKKLSQRLIADNPGNLLYELLDRLSQYCFPMLVHISNDIDTVEKRVFKEYEKDTILEILRIKTNIANFSKAIQGHKTIMDKLIKTNPPFLKISRLQTYFQNLVERKGEMWDLVDNYTHIINALHQTNESLINFRINEIIKTLTIFSVIVFPLTLLAAIFGMNIMNGMPFVETKYGFWIVVAIMGVGVAMMLGIFKKKKWL